MADHKYTSVEQVEQMLQTLADRIVLSDDEPTASNDVNMSYQQVDTIIDRVESAMELRFKRFYETPLTLTDVSTAAIMEDIATKLVGYEIWITIHTTITLDDVGAVIARWKTDAEEMIERIIPKGKEFAIDGRDLILGGETLRTSSGDAGTLNIKFTTKLPFGGSSS